MAEPGCNSSFRTGVIRWLDHGDFLEQPIGFGKGPNTGFPIFKALFQYSGGFKTKQNIEEFICVTPEQCAGEDGNVAGGRGQCAQSVALGRISSLQLMNFVSYGVIKEAIAHVPIYEVDRGKAAYLLPICLPKGTVEWPAGMIGPFTLAQYFAQLHLLEVDRQQALALSAEVDRRATFRIDDAALITSATCDLEGVPPEVPELGTVSSYDEHCRG